MNRLCIYHSSCSDGVAAAWAVYEHNDWKDATFYAGSYGKEPPWELIGDADEVLLVDFSYKHDVIREILDKCPKVTILDHHKTARDELIPLFDEKRIAGVFDMDYSGAELAWIWLHKHDYMPPLLEEIGKYDTWKPDRDYGLILALRSHPHAPATPDKAGWENLMLQWRSLMSNEGTEQLRKDGEALYRYYRQQVEQAKRQAYTAIIGGHRVPAVNTAPALSSDVAHEIAEEHGALFGCTWSYTKDLDIIVQLRTAGGFDVSEVAKQYGGGGHAGAAGFHTNVPDAGKLKLL